MMTPRLVALSIVLLAVVAPVVRGPAVSQSPSSGPRTGLDLLVRMQSVYRGKWFTSLTFKQQTTTRAADGTESVTMWYESLRYTPASGVQLRIDTGEPAAGNGVLYSADSLWRFRAGKQVAARSGGNALLPLIEGVYVQPMDRTARELAPTQVDLARAVVVGVWNRRPVWIAGAASLSDTTSPQFWVDTLTKAAVRAIFSPVPGAPQMDMRLEDLVQLDGGWLATRCEFFIGGKFTQKEQYQDWKANVELSPALFDPGTWNAAPHWAKQPPS